MQLTEASRLSSLKETEPINSSAINTHLRLNQFHSFIISLLNKSTNINSEYTHILRKLTYFITIRYTLNILMYVNEYHHGKASQ